MRLALVFSLILFYASTSLGQQENVYSRVFPDSVVIHNTGARENCAAKFAITVNSAGNLITITETDTVKEKMRCICTFDMSATLTGLSAGHYTVEVYRQYLEKYNYGSDTTVFIGLTEFDISDLGTPMIVVNKFQSDCYNTTGITEETPATSLILNNYPNPVYPEAIIRYATNTPGHVLLQIYDTRGQKTVTLVNEFLPAGTYEQRLTNDAFPGSGVYFCAMTSNGKTKTVKIAVIK